MASHWLSLLLLAMLCICMLSTQEQDEEEEEEEGEPPPFTTRIPYYPSIGLSHKEQAGKTANTKPATA